MSNYISIWSQHAFLGSLRVPLRTIHKENDINRLDAHRYFFYAQRQSLVTLIIYFVDLDFR